MGLGKGILSGDTPLESELGLQLRGEDEVVESLLEQKETKVPAAVLPICVCPNLAFFILA